MRAGGEEVRGLGRAVRALRRSKGWTQARLAEEAGVGRDAVVKLERGAREPRPATLERVGGVLGADLFSVLREEAMRHAPGLRSGPEDEGGAGRGERERPRVLLAAASRRESASGGEEGGFDLVEVLGGAESFEDFGRAIDRARAAGLLGVGIKDRASAPALPAGGGLADEIEAQRRGRLSD